MTCEEHCGKLLSSSHFNILKFEPPWGFQKIMVLQSYCQPTPPPRVKVMCENPHTCESTYVSKDRVYVRNVLFLGHHILFRTVQ